MIFVIKWEDEILRTVLSTDLFFFVLSSHKGTIIFKRPTQVFPHTRVLTNCNKCRNHHAGAVNKSGLKNRSSGLSKFLSKKSESSGMLQRVVG